MNSGRVQQSAIRLWKHLCFELFLLLLMGALKFLCFYRFRSTKPVFVGTMKIRRMFNCAKINRFFEIYEINRIFLLCSCTLLYLFKKLTVFIFKSSYKLFSDWWVDPCGISCGATGRHMKTEQATIGIELPDPRVWKMDEWLLPYRKSEYTFINKPRKTSTLNN